MLIDGVELKTLNKIHDDRGWLTEVLRNDEPMFTQFGQAYVTKVNYGVAKAWHYHKTQVDNFLVIHGVAHIVLVDLRTDSLTHEMVNVFDHTAMQALLQIPAGVYHGFTSISKQGAQILNLPNQVYNRTKPDEYRLPWDGLNKYYQWPSQVQRGG